MYLSRTASSSFVCNACQRAAARSSKLPFNGATQRTPLRSSVTPRRSSRCAFSTSTFLTQERNDLSTKDPEFAFLNESTTPPTETVNATEAESSPSAATELPTDADPQAELQTESAQPTGSAAPAADLSIPWYLRQQSALREQTHKPIEIPDLPPNPPPLLKTILEYVSITAGLDDLELLDLRHLDPPPALGPKLIMIIATARSEKHLHVAADTFSRWLRREHGLKANAAGLLGRNELKIKLRRKAKRMRMLANVGGAVMEGNIDDGIRTNWICCTLSKIEAHPDDMHMPGDNVEEFVGFRDVKPGVNVVVQMFTEEKRIETDLETLWGGVMRTHQRQDKAADDIMKELEEPLDYEDAAREDEEGAVRTTSTTHTQESTPATFVTPARRPRPTPGDVFPPASDADFARRIRRLHTVGLYR
jgi:ribosomal silencing factor RsfS